MSTYPDFAAKAVRRFYKNLRNRLIELLKTKSINKETTVEELLIIINSKIDNKKGGEIK